MITYQATIKEVGNDHTLTPSYSVCDDESKYFDRQYLIDFWGLDKPDVESYTIVEKRDFDESFYEHLYNAILDFSEDVYEVCSEYGPELEVDGLTVNLDVYFSLRWQDDSFDHLFGTQYYEPYLVIDYLEDIGNVTIEHNGFVVEGFDYDAFWAQFDRPVYKGIKKGDSVTYILHGKECNGVMVAYNMMKSQYKVNDGDKCVLVDKVNKL